jgi:class 3 adenylate cyclase
MNPTTAFDDDELLLDDAGEAPPTATSSLRWKVLVVDDDPDVRTVTRLALRDLVVDGVVVELACVESAAAARDWLRSNPDTAAAIVDVIMETDTAGLDLVEWVRRDLRDEAIRLVLRTGQPGSAPEAQVTSSYDIHDYLSKTETTARRLVTCVTGAVRAWRDMRTIHQQREGLRRALVAVGGLFETPNVSDLFCAILDQVTALLFPRRSSLLFIAAPDLSVEGAHAPVVLAATGVYAPYVGVPVADAIADEAIEEQLRSVTAGHAVILGQRVLYAFDVQPGVRPVLIIDGGELVPWERELVELYCHAVTLALRNRRLWEAQLAWFRAVERLVPSELSDLVGARDITAIAPGDSATHTMTVCFVDIRSFSARTTAIGGHRAFQLLNRLFASLGEVVRAHHGIIDKYLGDGMLVLFPGAAEDAVNAALEMQERTRAISAGEPEPIAIGIGLQRGEVLVGAVGHATRIDLTVVSPAVNQAARIQELCRTLSCDILLSEEVYAEMSSTLQAECRPVLRHTLRGDNRARALWEAYSASAPQRRAVCLTHAAALEAAAACEAAGDLDGAFAALERVPHGADPTVDALRTLHHETFAAMAGPA